ncbi:MAG TPA: hypothetical protein VJM11_09650 [Nevskiaceae bacterium]|nr:hypothetical protein [Nevskiaceae bacterium]
MRRWLAGVAVLAAGTTLDVTAGANQAPVSRPGADRILTVEEGTDVLLDGTDSSDADGTIVSYRWRQESGPDVTILTPRAAKTRFAAPTVVESRDVVLMLRVEDDNGAQDAARIRITFRPNNERPQAHAGFNKEVDLQPGGNVRLKGIQSTDPDGTIAGYEWRQLPGGPRYEIRFADQPEAMFTMPALVQDQEVSFRLRVVDNQGATDADDVTILLRANTPPPTITSFTINAATVETGQATRVRWESANADSCVASGAWSGPRPPQGSRIVGPFAKAGPRTFGLVCIGAEDSKSAKATVTLTVEAPKQRNIDDPPPPASDGTLEDEDEAGRIADLLEALCQKVGCTPPPPTTAKALVPRAETACVRGGVRDVLGPTTRDVGSPFSDSEFLVVSAVDTECALPVSSGNRTGTAVTSGAFENGCPVDDDGCSADTVSQTEVGFSSVGDESGAFVRRFTGYNSATQTNFDEVLRVTGTIHAVDRPDRYRRSIVQVYDGENRRIGLDGTQSTSHFSGYYGEPGKPFLVKSEIRQASPLQTYLRFHGPMALESDLELPCSEGRINVRHKRRAPEEKPARLLVDAQGRFIGGSIIFETSTKAWIVNFNETGKKKVQACAPLEEGPYAYDCGGEWTGTRQCDAGKAATTHGGCGTPIDSGPNPNEEFFVSPLGGELGTCPFGGF